MKYFSRALSAHYRHNKFYNGGVERRVIWFGELAPAYSQKPAHDGMKGPIFVLIYTFPILDFGVFFLFFIRGEQRTKAPSSLHRIIDYQRSVFFSSFVLPLSKCFLIFKWKNHGIYEIHSSARINNRPWNRCSSRRRELRAEFFSIYVRT